MQIVIEKCLCPKEVADVLGVSERSAQRLMGDGEIASFRVGKLLRTRPSSVRRYQTDSFVPYRRKPKAAA